jgi:hypothetical protein
MIFHKRHFLFGVFALAAAAQLVLSEEPAKHYTRDQMEQFLMNAKVVSTKPIGVGVTHSERAMLSDGTIEHEAHIQQVDIQSNQFSTRHGTELNFKDTFKYNIAAYKLDKLMDLNMIPVSIERKVSGKTSAVTWWVDDKMFDETDRVKQGIEPPDKDAWNKQMYVVRVFDQLIANTDRNLGNLVIDKRWRMWMIDHTRAFRTDTKLLSEKNLVMCDRKLMASMKKLDEATMEEQLRPYLSKTEIKAILGRRDKIVKFFEAAAQEKGEGAVMYDLPALP